MTKPQVTDKELREYFSDAIADMREVSEVTDAQIATTLLGIAAAEFLIHLGVRPAEFGALAELTMKGIAEGIGQS
jgi:hypothetical protein